MLICNKCTKKLKKNGADLANVKKWFKKRQKETKTGQIVRVIGVNCVKMCPKNGITVATQQQLGRNPAEVSIVYSEADLEALYASVTSPHAAY